MPTPNPPRLPLQMPRLPTNAHPTNMRLGDQDYYSSSFWRGERDAGVRDLPTDVPRNEATLIALSKGFVPSDG